VGAGGVDDPQREIDSRDLDRTKSEADFCFFLVDGDDHREGVGDCCEEFFQQDLVLFLKPCLLKRLGPDIPAGIDSHGKPEAQFQKGLNQDFVVKAPVKEPDAKAVQKIHKLGDKINDGLVHADKRAGFVGKDKREQRETDRRTQPDSGLQPPVSLDDFLLGAVPDTAEIFDDLGIGPFQGRKITSDGGVFMNPGVEEFDATFSQPVPVDPQVRQEPAESFDLVEGFLEPVFSRDGPLGEAGGPGGD